MEVTTKSMPYEAWKDNEYIENLVNELKSNGVNVIVGSFDKLINWGRSFHVEHKEQYGIQIIAHFKLSHRFASCGNATLIGLAFLLFPSSFLCLQKECHGHVFDLYMSIKFKIC